MDTDTFQKILWSSKTSKKNRKCNMLHHNSSLSDCWEFEMHDCNNACSDSVYASFSASPKRRRLDKSTKNSIRARQRSLLANCLQSLTETVIIDIYNYVDRICIFCHSPVDQHTDKCWNEHKTEFEIVKISFRVAALRKAGQNTTRYECFAS